jgi:predicted patatin/cPLA2 family phospholipase
MENPSAESTAGIKRTMMMLATRRTLDIVFIDPIPLREARDNLYRALVVVLTKLWRDVRTVDVIDEFIALLFTQNYQVSLLIENTFHRTYRISYDLLAQCHPLRLYCTKSKLS